MSGRLDPTITIGDRVIGGGHPCCIVAECGQNHNGDVRILNDLWRAAHMSRADFVKFCKRDLQEDMTSAMRSRPYVGPHSYGATYGEHRAALELSMDEYRLAIDRARYNRWSPRWLVTACDRVSVEQFKRLNPAAWKVASRDLDNEPLLRCLKSTGLPVILSTGMAEPGELDRSIDLFGRNYPLAILYCVSRYPTSYSDLNLHRIPALAARYRVPVGFSDHTTGLKAAIAAVALGAKIIEKHITLSRAMAGSDHAGSLEPLGLAKLVRDVRDVEQALKPGNPDTTETRLKLGRSIVAARRIDAGEVIEESDLCYKSPGSGMRWRDRGAIVGTVAPAVIEADTQFQANERVRT